MPLALKNRVRALSETATLDMSAARAPADPESLMAMASAAQAQRRVRFSYRTDRDEVSTRDFDPYGLVFRSGRWYVSGKAALQILRPSTTTGLVARRIG